MKLLVEAPASWERHIQQLEQENKILRELAEAANSLTREWSNCGYVEGAVRKVIENYQAWLKLKEGKDGDKSFLQKLAELSDEHGPIVKSVRPTGTTNGMKEGEDGE